MENVMHGKDKKRALAISRGKQPKYGESNFNYVYSRCKGSAAQRRVFWGITKEEFRKISSCNCYYCNAKPSNISPRHKRIENGYYIWNGMDRLDATRGYTVDNVVTCCAMCNRMRMAWSQEEFLAKIKQIYENLKLSGRK